MDLVLAAKNLFGVRKTSRKSLRTYRRSIFAMQAREEIKKMIKLGNVPVVSL